MGDMPKLRMLKGAHQYNKIIGSYKLMKRAIEMAEEAQQRVDERKKENAHLM